MPFLCFGGSFNPVHWGHLRCAQVVAEKRGFKGVLLIPAAISPHKTGTAEPPASSADRLAMCRLAIQEHTACRGALGNVRFEVSDLELKRPPPSFTIDTVRALKAQGWPEVHWLIGADQVPALPKWHEPQALLREATLLVMARPGFRFDWDSLPAEFRGLSANVVEAPLIDVSATDIRRRVRDGQLITGLVPASVEAYIHAQGLYLAMPPAPDAK